MKFVLFHFPAACSRVTMNALEEIGVDYETRMVNLATNEQNGAEYKALNPKGKVPSLSIDGKLLTENPAILRLLATLYPAARLLPLSGDPLRDVQPHIDMAWCAATLHPIVRQVRNPQRFSTGETAGVQADGIEKMNKEWAGFEARLTGGRWWYGAEWSILDTYVYWIYSTSGRSELLFLDQFPALIAHAKRVRERPAFQRVLQRERAALEAANLPVPGDL